MPSLLRAAFLSLTAVEMTYQAIEAEEFCPSHGEGKKVDMNSKFNGLQWFCFLVFFSHGKL